MPQMTYAFGDGCVLEEDDGYALSCTCQKFQAEAFRLRESQDPTPPWCKHLRAVIAERRDRGFLTERRPYSGEIRAVTLYYANRGLLRAWAVVGLVPVDDDTPAERTLYQVGIDDHEVLGFAFAGTASRKDIQTFVAPALILAGLERPCLECQATWMNMNMMQGLPFRPENVSDRYEALVRGAFLLNHEGLCPDCTTSDLIPNV